MRLTVKDEADPEGNGRSPPDPFLARVRARGPGQARVLAVEAARGTWQAKESLPPENGPPTATILSDHY
jgi:hypothetical protein